VSLSVLRVVLLVLVVVCLAVLADAGSFGVARYYGGVGAFRCLSVVTLRYLHMWAPVSVVVRWVVGVPVRIVVGRPLVHRSVVVGGAGLSPACVDYGGVLEWAGRVVFARMGVGLSV
jgi:hypothetical protein